MASGTTVVILAAGKGTRMRSRRPKVLHPLCGRPLVAWVVEQALSLSADRVVLVVGHGAGEVGPAAQEAAGSTPLEVVVQEPQLGTGHAVQVAAHAIGDPKRVVVLYGDMPLLRAESLAELVAAQNAAGPGATGVMTARPEDPRGYGRIVRGAEGEFECITEEKDCTGEELAIAEVNLGVYCFDGASLKRDLPALSNDNAQGEYYLTDLPGMAVTQGRPVVTVDLADHHEAAGVNTVAQLADARWVMQARILEQHMEGGVLIEDPATTYIDYGVEIGAGTHVLPCTYVHTGVKIGEGCEVGPFTHLRSGTVLEDAAQVGNFTECKNSTLGAGSKAKHLTYLGDTHVGAKTNIGAGTIFANYDGRTKHKTKVGDGVFVGSGTIVVAPNLLPDGVTTGAGAVVTRSAGMQPGDTYVGVPARRLPQRAAAEEG
ncbi:MAG: NTP transferase domain-containing protein [Planctomycetota bacterium]|nr:NTP transferase domain-containing protein [Planctomycetota bacterium]